MSAIDRTLPAAGRFSLAGPAPLVAACGLLLAVGFVLAKQAALAGVPPLAFAFWHAVGGAVLTGGLVLARPEARASLRGRLAPVIRYSLAAGLMSMALPNAIAFSAVAELGAGQVALVYAMPPVLTYAIVVALRHEPLAWRRGLGVLLSVGGLLAAMAPVWRAGLSGPLAWWLMLLSVPVAISAANVYRSRRWPAGVQALPLAFGMLAAAALWLLPVLAWRDALWLPLPGRPGTAPVLAQMAISGLTFILYFRLQKVGGPVVLSQIGPVSAVGGLALGAAMLGEVHSPWLLGAIPLVVAGAALVTRPLPR
ncbi:MAG TPA: DMT family transporter [Azospirillaceae bacterium]|nr:DMT family transporter [Azospirillaceae bacterium]